MPYKIWINPEYARYDVETITHQNDELTLYQARDNVQNYAELILATVIIMRDFRGVINEIYVIKNDDIDMLDITIAEINYYEPS